MSNNIPQNVDYINTTFNLPNIRAKRIWLLTETNWLPTDRRMLPLQVKKIGNSWRNNLLREKVKRRGGKQLFAFPALIAKFRYSWVRKPNQLNSFLMWEKQLMNNSEDERTGSKIIKKSLRKFIWWISHHFIVSLTKTRHSKTN